MKLQCVHDLSSFLTSIFLSIRFKLTFFFTVKLLDVSQETPPTLRPGNPTPGHATGQGSPAPVRPTNPTPANAMKSDQNIRPGAPTPKEAGGGDESSRENPTSRDLQDMIGEGDIQEETGDMLNGVMQPDGLDPTTRVDSGKMGKNTSPVQYYWEGDGGGGGEGDVKLYIIPTIHEQ